MNVLMYMHARMQFCNLVAIYLCIDFNDEGTYVVINIL